VKILEWSDQAKITRLFSSPAGDVLLPQIRGSFTLLDVPFLVILTTSGTNLALLLMFWRKNQILELAEQSQLEMSSLSNILSSPIFSSGWLLQRRHAETR
jgi:hypothetical protein